MDNHTIFISYSSVNKDVAFSICSELEKNNFNCWIAPRDITPGKEWGEAIIDAINTSKIMVLIFSEASNNSQQVLREVERAVNKNVIIIPFRIENALPTKSMEYFLYSTHWLDAVSTDTDKSIKVLIETVSKLISNPKGNDNLSQIKPLKQRDSKRKLLLAASSVCLLFVLAIAGLYLFKSNQDSKKTINNKTASAKVQSRHKSSAATAAPAASTPAASAPKDKNQNSSSNKAISTSLKTNKSDNNAPHSTPEIDNKKESNKSNGDKLSKSDNNNDNSSKDSKNKKNKKHTRKKSGSAEKKKPSVANTEKPSTEVNSTQNDSKNTETAKSTPKGKLLGVSAKQPSSNSKISKKQDNESYMFDFKTGAYISFGNYNGEPIIWRVIHIDASGNPLLFSTKILSLKAFDASESGNYFKTKGGKKFENQKYTTDKYFDIFKDYAASDLREMMGSNNWINSNIREWLNSDKKAVNFSTAAPKAASITNSDNLDYANNYDNEPGFLYNFNSKEKSLIKEVNHKVILSDIDKNAKDGGNELFKIKGSVDVRDALANYDNAYYSNVADKVFLLSISDALNYIVDKGLDLTASPTSQAVDRDKSHWYKDFYGSKYDGKFMWWLNTPVANNPCGECIVTSDGKIASSSFNNFAHSNGVGIRPALYISNSSLKVKGEGTESNPYTIDK